MSKRFVVYTLLAAAAANCLVFISNSVAADDVCKITKDAFQQASAIRGLKIKQQVPCHVHDREKVKQYLKETTLADMAKAVEKKQKKRKSR